MSSERCEMEGCPFWTGEGGCICSLMDINEDERNTQRRRIEDPW